MPHFGTGEIVVILIIVVLIFGANRLPQIGEGFGKAIKNFKRGLSSDEDIKVSSEKQIPPHSSANNVNAEAKHPEEAEIVEKKHDNSA